MFGSSLSPHSIVIQTVFVAIGIRHRQYVPIDRTNNFPFGTTHVTVIVFDQFFQQPRCHSRCNPFASMYAALNEYARFIWLFLFSCLRRSFDLFPWSILCIFKWYLNERKMVSECKMRAICQWKMHFNAPLQQPTVFLRTICQCEWDRQRPDTFVANNRQTLWCLRNHGIDTMSLDVLAALPIQLFGVAIAPDSHIWSLVPNSKWQRRTESTRSRVCLAQLCSCRVEWECLLGLWQRSKSNVTLILRYNSQLDEIHSPQRWTFEPMNFLAIAARLVFTQEIHMGMRRWYHTPNLIIVVFHPFRYFDFGMCRRLCRCRCHVIGQYGQPLMRTLRRI